MGQTIIEKIISQHSDHAVTPGEIVWMNIDVRSARDFGGANVVKNLRDNYVKDFINDIDKTCFTFDCNAPANTVGYADNQQICRVFAEQTGVPVYDVDAGIGSHVLLERGLAAPGKTLVGTDSHLNIIGAIGALGLGMGDQDIAFTFKTGRTWFEVPPTIKINIIGSFQYPTSAKDVTLAILKTLGTKGALSCAIEFYGQAVESLSLAGRLTLASMATEMGAVTALMVPNEEIAQYCQQRSRETFQITTADADATYLTEITVDVADIQPQIARPFSPAKVVDVSSVDGVRVHSGFIGSCTNGRFEDFAVAASILKGKKIADGFILKIVPATSEVYDQMLDEGLIKIFRNAGALVSNPGCGGCASGQIGMIGSGEVQVSTSNRNFRGKQGWGDTYLASPATVAATALFGKITNPQTIDHEFLSHHSTKFFQTTVGKKIARKRKPTRLDHMPSAASQSLRPQTPGPGPTVGRPRHEVIKGRAYRITDTKGTLIDDIDTDMIFHNRYLHIKNIKEMGQYTFDNLRGHENFSKLVHQDSIIIAGKNFGCGSSRQQAVACFLSLGVQLILCESAGAIYKRNAINSGLAILLCDGLSKWSVEQGDELEVNVTTGEIRNKSKSTKIYASKFSQVQWKIYLAGNIFNYAKKI